MSSRDVVGGWQCIDCDAGSPPRSMDVDVAHRQATEHTNKVGHSTVAGTSSGREPEGDADE